MPAKKNSKKMKGISRIDSKGTHGWYVRVYTNGKTYSKLYSDNKYGGKERALKFAQKARQDAVNRLKNDPANKNDNRPNLIHRNKNNSTGVVGVTKARKKNRSGNYSEIYQARWTNKYGKIKMRQWSIRKYGEEEAFRLACQFRHYVMKQIHGDDYDPEKAKTEAYEQWSGKLNQNSEAAFDSEEADSLINNEEGDSAASGSQSDDQAVGVNRHAAQ